MIKDRPSSNRSVPILHVLVVVTIILALSATLAGLFWPGGHGAYTITSYRGKEVEIFGEGVYRDSSTFNGAGARGTDLITRLIAIPMLILNYLRHRRASVAGMVFLAGALVWMVYVYSSMALGTTAYNDLFLLYVALFGTATWSLVLLLTSVDMPSFVSKITPEVPRTLPGRFLIVAGVITAMIWLLEPLGALLAGEYPEILGVSTTLYTHAFDTAVIAPAAVIAGVLICGGSPIGYLAGLPLMLLLALLTPAIIAQTLFQRRAGIDFAPAQVTIMIGGFLVVGVLAIIIVGRVLRHLRPLGR